MKDSNRDKQLGRPLTYEQPRRRLTLELPQELVEQIDARARASGMTRTAWIDAALRETVERITGE